MGYATVTQATSFATAVTVNGVAGAITLESTSTLAAGARITFLVNNSAVRRNSIIILQFDTNLDLFEQDAPLVVSVYGKTAGTFRIAMKNVGAETLLASAGHQILFSILFVD